MSNRACERAIVYYVYDYDPTPSDDMWEQFRALNPGERVPMMNQEGEVVAYAIVGEVIENDDPRIFEIELPE